MFYPQLTEAGDPYFQPPQETAASLLCDLVRELDLARFVTDQLDCSKWHWMTTPLGTTGADELLTRDIGLMPHMLVAGTTGSGKSVFMSSIIAWMHLRSMHDEHILLIDPKCVEFSIFDGSPLVVEVVTEASRAYGMLITYTNIMDKRFRMMQKVGVRDVRELEIKPMMIFIDEWADLVLQNRKIEEPLIRLAQKGRAAGIHLILGTQRPTRDVITGLIKANFPARVCFGVPSALDSRIVLDENGGEMLDNPGDAIYARGRDKHHFKSMIWSDDQINRAIRCSKLAREDRDRNIDKTKEGC